MTEIIVVVGFKRTAKNSIGYMGFSGYDAPANYVKELLSKGADVISIRRVDEE